MSMATAQLPMQTTDAETVAVKKRLPGARLAGRRQQFLYAMMYEAKTEDLRKIVRSMIRSAMKGNVTAASLVLDRLCGKADQVLTLTGPNGGPIQLDVRAIFDANGFVDQLKTLTETVPTIGREGTEVVEGTEVTPHTPVEKQGVPPGPGDTD